MLIDSHCHLDAEAFDGDRGAVVGRAKAAGIRRQVVPATHASGWQNLCEICADDDGLFPAYGLHPMFLDRHVPEHLEDLHGWLERERPVAVGECGLDYYIDEPNREAQKRYFDAQLRLARDFDLPVIIHARRAVDAVIASIREIGNLRGVVHSFSGSRQQAEQLWAHGFLLGLGGPVTYERARRLRRLVADMPLEHLLLETDAPDQPDAGIRGERNEPVRLATICGVIAELRDEPPEKIAEATTDNAIRLFGLPASFSPL